MRHQNEAAEQRAIRLAALAAFNANAQFVHVVANAEKRRLAAGDRAEQIVDQRALENVLKYVFAVDRALGWARLLSLEKRGRNARRIADA